MTERQKIDINRPLVGIISLVCLALWLAYLFTPTEWRAGTSFDNDMFAGGFMRVGLLMGAFWFALPGKDREAAWASVTPEVLVGGLICLYFVARQPRTLLVILPLMIVLGVLSVVLRPKPKDRPRSRPQ